MKKKGREYDFLDKLYKDKRPMNFSKKTPEQLRADRLETERQIAEMKAKKNKPLHVKIKREKTTKDPV